MRMRKKPNLIPRMERCASFLIQDPKEQRGNWRALMPQAKQVWLEIGCGKGRFTAEMARQNPEVLYLALERVLDAMIVAVERCAKLELSNVFSLMRMPPTCGTILHPERWTGCLSISATRGPPTAMPAAA